MIKVGKILGIMEIFFDFFLIFFAFVDFCGDFWSTRSCSEHSDFVGGDFFWEHSEHSECGEDGGDWGLVGAGVSQLL